jgi:formylglycine-generating enzyme required for sulfatase activity
MVKASLFVGPAACALAIACSAVLGIDGLVADRVPDAGASESGATEGGPDGSSGCASTCGTPGCGDCPTPARVSFGAYSMDPYEVTAASYKAWLATSPSLAVQREECASNDSFVPGALSPIARAVLADGGFSPDPACAGWLDANPNPKMPIVCVDWCDAIAYCAWTGGHLCRGTDGRSLLYRNDPTPARGEWWSACSTNGANAYPYGNTYVNGRCNDSNSHVAEVGHYPDCQVKGVFDLSGNVTEWEDSCSDYNDIPEAQNCLRRGGAFFDNDAGLTCTAYREATRGSQDSDHGFRCCGP